MPLVLCGVVSACAKIRENRQNLHTFNLWPVEYHTGKNSCPNLKPVLLYIEIYKFSSV